MDLNGKRENLGAAKNSTAVCPNKKNRISEFVKACAETAVRITKKIKHRKHDRLYADDWKFDLKFTAVNLRNALKNDVAPDAQNIECIIKADGKEFTIRDVTSEYDDFTGFNYPIIDAEEI